MTRQPTWFALVHASRIGKSHRSSARHTSATWHQKIPLLTFSLLLRLRESCRRFSSDLTDRNFIRVPSLLPRLHTLRHMNPDRGLSGRSLNSASHHAGRKYHLVAPATTSVITPQFDHANCYFCTTICVPESHTSH